MMGVNRVIVVGRLGQDPDVRYLPADGKQVTTLSLATSERWKDQSGQQQERTEWHRVVMFGRLAEIASQYLSKGAPVYIEGKLRTRKWQDQNGHDRYTTEIIADQMQMLGSREGGGGGSAPRSSQPSRESVKASEEFQAPPSAGGFEDDIPFAPMPNV